MGWASSGSELAKAFGELDVEGSGEIEIKDLALAIQAAQPGIDDEKVAAMLSLIDEDGDGTVRPRDPPPPPSPAAFCKPLPLTLVAGDAAGVRDADALPGGARQGARLKCSERGSPLEVPAGASLLCLRLYFPAAGDSGWM